MEKQIDGTQGAGPGLSKRDLQVQTLLYRKQQGASVTVAAGVPWGWRGTGETFIHMLGCTETQMLLWVNLSSLHLGARQAPAQVLDGDSSSNQSHIYQALWGVRAMQGAPNCPSPCLRKHPELGDAQGRAGPGPRSSGSSPRERYWSCSA